MSHPSTFTRPEVTVGSRVRLSVIQCSMLYAMRFAADILNLAFESTTSALPFHCTSKVSATGTSGGPWIAAMSQCTALLYGP